MTRSGKIPNISIIKIRELHGSCILMRLSEHLLLNTDNFDTSFQDQLSV